MPGDTSKYSLHLAQLLLADEVWALASTGVCKLQRLCHCQNRQVAVVLRVRATTDNRMSCMKSWP
jgi:hypothetical protein